jgi:hypothetical protein
MGHKLTLRLPFTTDKAPDRFRQSRPGAQYVGTAVYHMLDNGPCNAQIVVISAAKRAVNSVGQIIATVGTFAVVPKISSHRPKLEQYRSGQARSAVIE